MSKPITEPGKGSYWTVDYAAGAGTKRPRKRNKKGGAAGKSQGETQEGGEDEQSASQAEQSSKPKPTKPPSSFSHSIPTAERYRPYESYGVPSRTLTSRLESDYRKRHPNSPRLPTRSSHRGSDAEYSRASGKQNARDHPQMDQGMRSSEGSYGGPAFGQPAFNPAAFRKTAALREAEALRESAAFKESGSSLKTPATTWPMPGPSQPPMYHFDSLQHRSSSHSFSSLDQLPPLQNFPPRPRPQPPSRANTLPTNIAEAFGDTASARGPLLPPPRDMYDQARNDYSRFPSTRSYQGPPDQHYSFAPTRSYTGQSTTDYHSFASPPSRPYHEPQTAASASAEHAPPSAQGSSGGARRDSPSESESSHD